VFCNVNSGKLQAKPVELDSIEDPDVQDQIDARQNSATDKALILDAQSSWARTQDRLLAKQRLRLQERTGIAFPEPAPVCFCCKIPPEFFMFVIYSGFLHSNSDPAR
jgi:hypothetical protein